jgi:hypothetical protein
MATRRTVSAKDGAAAIAMLDAEKRAAAEPAADGTDQRRCIGSAKFGIEAHEAPAADFPIQPSQKDGLGRMCKPHWNEYTTALRKAALARKAAEGETPAGSVPTEAPKPSRTRVKRANKAIVPEGGAQGDAG